MSSKKKLSQEILTKVKQFVESGLSWTAMEKILKGEGINVSRHVIRREYEEWSTKQPKEYLKDVRNKIAEEEFHIHLIELTTFAGVLPSILKLPPLGNISGDSKAAIKEGLSHLQLHQEDEVLEHILRRNSILLKSLRQHTNESISWDCWDNWWRDFDSLVSLTNDLKLKVKTRIDSHIVMDKGFADKLKKTRGSRKTKQAICDEIVNVLWINALDRIKEPPEELFKMFELDEGVGNKYSVRVNLGDHCPDIVTKSDDVVLCNQIARLCDSTILVFCNDLETQSTYHRMQTIIKSAQSNIAAMTNALDPMLVRPVIIRTNCDICPVLV